jgi:hypothetical protein
LERSGFPLSKTTFPAVERYVQLLKQKYVNGDVIFKSFEIPSHPVADWYFVRRNLESWLFFRELWFTPSPREVLSALKVPVGFENRPAFEWGNSFTFAGELASVLFRGGAYSVSDGTGVSEMQLSTEVANELIQGRYTDIYAYTNHAPWTEFFFDVAWDCTWLLLDRSLRKIHLLFATDTD